MSKYKVGDKVVFTVTGMNERGQYPKYILNYNFYLWKQGIDNYAEPLSTYTEPLEAKIRRQAAEITRLLAENEKLKAESGNVIWEIKQAFDRGCSEAWELARKITCQPINGGFNRSEFEKIFGYGYISDIFEKYKYTEAAAKVAEWEKTKAKILVKAGDVLENIYDSNVKCIVTNLYPNNRAYLVFDDGTAGMNELNNFKKTGRHIDIDSFLKQIGEE